jgi:riboflavin synthase
VSAVTAEGAGRRVTVEVPPDLRPLLIPKGSVAVDGVSLTVAGLAGSAFSVALIPHTLAVTTLGSRAVGAAVNLEMDVLGKYVRALLPAGEADRAVLAGQGLLAPGGGGLA